MSDRTPRAGDKTRFYGDHGYSEFTVQPAPMVQRYLRLTADQGSVPNEAPVVHDRYGDLLDAVWDSMSDAERRECNRLALGEATP